MFKAMDERGQMIPFISAMLIIVLLFATYSISTTMMFMQRKTVEDALDAAILSVAMASVEERTKPTYYYDYLVWVCTDRDDEGHCIDGYYYVAQSSTYYKNYIYVKSDAKKVLETGFLRNLNNNSPQAKVKNLKLELEYDDERFLLVRKRLDYLHGSSDPDIHGSSSNPSSWWLSEFSGTKGFLYKPEPWSGEEYEDRIVRFPRWVKITAIAEVEVPSLMGRFLAQGGNTVTVTVRSSVVRELLKVNRPAWSW